MGVADDDALARGQAVGLDDQRQPLRAHVALIEICGREGSETCGWNAMAVEKILGEGFRTLALRDGPKQRRLAAAKRSTMPATNGASGPTMVRSISSAMAN